MKFGVIAHPSTQNIGDDIQTFAAAWLLPEVDYFLDRECMDDFEPPDKKPVAVLMSAWYMWHKWNWPPSEYIVPLFVGMHYTDNELAKQDGSPVGEEFLSGMGGEYLNCCSPIGCRDSYTTDEMKGLGIDAYFSGCVTLTIPKMPQTSDKNEYVCCTDVSKAVVERVRSMLEGTGIELREIKHYRDYRAGKATWEEREAVVKELLTVYQNARCVITRRLHCALPCLAMETPVLVINDEKAGADIRFEPYYDWLHNCPREVFLSGEYEFDPANPPENSKAYLPYRDNLVRTVKDFVEKYKNSEELPEALSDFYKDRERLVRWRHDTMKDCMNRWLYVTREHIHSIAKLDVAVSENERLKQQIKELKLELKSLDAECSSLKKENSGYAKKLKSTDKALDKCEKENKRFRKILSCRTVRYAIRFRNLLVRESKRIDLDHI